MRNVAPCGCGLLSAFKLLCGGYLNPENSLKSILFLSLFLPTMLGTYVSLVTNEG